MLNYDVSYAHDELGFTTRTINGMLRIPQHGRTSKVFDTPENYRDKIRIPMPRGYKSGGISTRVNAAQNELHFSVIHKQLDHEPYPAGLSKCNVTFSTHGRAGEKGGGVLPFWTFMVQGDMETIPGFPKSWAALRFYQIAFARASLVYRALTAGYSRAQKPVMLIVSADAVHQPYVRSSNFRMSWGISGAVNGQLFRPAVLYNPLPPDQSNYDAWVNTPYNAASLQRLWTAGGQTGLRTLAPDIVDLCTPTYSATLNSAANGYPLGAAPDGFPSDFFGCQNVAPENSWLAYEPVAQLHRTENVEVNKHDVDAAIANLRSMLANGPSPQQSYGQTSTSSGQPYNASDDTTSRVGLPEQRLVFKGKAVRVHYPVSIPVIRSIEGVQLTLLHNVQESTPFAQLYGGCSLYSGRWIQVYRPDKYLSGKVLSMPHPNIQVVNENAVS